ncbi:MAG TPA: valine--tRNA ligase, partial [Gemmatimonadales bacterium]|nr:valine--tRNA ligase [Gemmatimonadales bacterium]
PLVDRLIPVVADEAVDPAFGSGAVKVTPAHDPTDFEIGRRHELPSVDVMTPEARMSLAVPERFQGLDRFEARKRVAAELESQGLLEKVENHRHAVGHCYRCETVIEPRLSEQWFVRMEPLARPALARYRDGTIRFIPERRGDDYERWLDGIRDWCISRQLWWGHRIPVWYCEAERCARISVSRTDLSACPGCGGAVRQDEDVLDTWFSSWLVPFTSLGWPERTEDLATYYPGHTLVSSPDIIFFWVSRMIMSGLEFMGELPYTRIYLHGVVRDTRHRKMSKSLGNGIDPLEVVDRYGADALRYSLISGMSVGTDVILDPDDLDSSFAPARNFANKVWNAGRFILSNLDGPTRPLAGRSGAAVRREELTLADRWIIARCDATVREATDAYERFRLNEAAGAVYRFLWSDLADWYIEQIKPRLYGDVPGGDVARAVAVQTFDVALRLLHPVMPFITEALWRRFPGRPAEASISVAPWPLPDRRAEDAEALREFGLVQEVVGAIRAIRAEYGVQPGQPVRAVVTLQRGGAAAGRRDGGAIHREEATVTRLAKVSELSFGEPRERVGGHAVLSDGTSVFVPLGDAIDLDRECGRLGAERQRLTQLVEAQEKKLGNQQFVSRAPADVVRREREKAATWRDQRDAVARKLTLLGCGAAGQRGGGAA